MIYIYKRVTIFYINSTLYIISNNAIISKKNIILHKVIINYILSNNLSKCKHKLFNIYFS